MRSSRKIFNTVLDKTSGYISLEYLLKHSKQNLILPFYHTISNYKLAHISNLYKIKTEKEFIKDLDFLLKNFEPLSYEDFLLKKKTKKPSFLLSFDDGLKEFYEIIAPILIKKGIPAICFLNSGFIDNKDLFYRYKVSLLINEFNKNTSLKKHIDCIDIEKYLLGLSYNDIPEIDAIAKSISYDFSDFLQKEKPYLNSSQIKELINKGFYFGAHSVDHPEYQYISIEEQITQTKDSVLAICSKFNLDYKIFSFPFTDFNVSKKFFEEINSLDIVDVTFGTAGQKKDEILNNIHRIPFEKKGLTAEKILKKELFYYLIKKPFAKNIIYRT